MGVVRRRRGTAADLFHALYRVDGTELDLSGVRVHDGGADMLCEMLGAEALTVGTDIFFRSGTFSPHTVRGLWVLAHEVAHVAQRHRGPVSALPLASGIAVGVPGGSDEREADAAADAVLAGRAFAFAPSALAGRAFAFAPGINLVDTWGAGRENGAGGRS
jgi:Domain of unknown function (DUF4157)